MHSQNPTHGYENNESLDMQLLSILMTPVECQFGARKTPKFRWLNIGDLTKMTFNGGLFFIRIANCIYILG